MAIETEHLQLTPLEPKNLLALINGREQFSADFGLKAADGLREFFVTDEVPTEFISRLNQSTGTDPWRWGFAIIDKASEQVVGTAGFKGEPDNDGAVEIAYAIVPSFENKGYATEAAAQLVAYAQRDSRVQVIRAHTLPEQNASARVLQKNGFENVGTVKDPDDGNIWQWQYVDKPN